MQNLQKINYQEELDKILSCISRTSEKPSLLLHACCAPCSSYVLEYLSEYFLITLYYYNPNIHPKEEYDRRFNELKEFVNKFPVAIQNGVTLLQANYCENDFDNALRVDEEPALAKEKERGTRCERCYAFRMENAYSFAIQNNYDWFTTTLSISPHKDAKKINDIGKRLESFFEKLNGKVCTKFLTSDFKKRNGFKRSLELSREFELYRQKYCGCKYSAMNCGNLS